MAITLATGRRFATVRPQLAQLGITLPVILQSGAQIVDPTSGEQAQKIVERLYATTPAVIERAKKLLGAS